MIEGVRRCDVSPSTRRDGVTARSPSALSAMSSPGARGTTPPPTILPSSTAPTPLPRDTTAFLDRLRAFASASDPARSELLEGDDAASSWDKTDWRVAAMFQWDEPVKVTRAPGRIDVMGGIADYSGATVVQSPTAVATHVAAQRRVEDDATPGKLIIVSRTRQKKKTATTKKKKKKTEEGEEEEENDDDDDDDDDDGPAVDRGEVFEMPMDQARSISRWSPYDRVRVVNAVPEGLCPARLSAQGPSLSTPALDAFQLRF